MDNNYFIMKNNFDLHKNQILITYSLFLTKTDSIKKQNKYINGLKRLYDWTNKHNYILEFIMIILLMILLIKTILNIIFS